MTTSDADAVLRPVSAPSRWRLLRQVSLRTCLGLVTLGCIWLAVVSQRAREQRLAIERILAVGGSVAYAHQRDSQGRFDQNAPPPGSPWLRMLLGDGYFEQVTTVDLDKSQVSDADMQVIGKLRGITTLALHRTNISDKGLKPIATWNRLDYLGLLETQVTSSGLRHIEGLQSLNTLILQKTNVDDRAMPSILTLQRLEMLNLSETKITSASVPQLATLRLSFLGVAHTRVDDSAVSHLCAMKSLTWLTVNDTQVSGEGLWKLREALPDCDLDGEIVDLSNLGTGPDPPAGYWAGVAKQRLAPLHDEGRLKLLDLSGTSFADRHLDQLTGFTNLQMLDLRETRVTDAGVETLRQSLPGCKIAR